MPAAQPAGLSPLSVGKFQVLFFRRQTLSPDQMIAVARVFGDPDKAKAFFPRHDTHHAIKILEAQAESNRYGTDEWHADITFVANPPIGTVLYAQVVPASGGDTVWASATAVYDSLPRSLQLYLEELEATHSFEHSGWPPYFARQPDGEARYRQARIDHRPVVHPVIRTHPVTGRKIVYVSPNFTDRIQGLPRQESDAPLSFLFARFQRPEFHARLRWEKNTVAIWDNRSTQHYGVADYGARHRLLHRVTFGEDSAFDSHASHRGDTERPSRGGGLNGNRKARLRISSAPTATRGNASHQLPRCCSVSRTPSNPSEMLYAWSNPAAVAAAVAAADR